jgi:peptidoglycan/xylan/chitin deacetylase (PgdA/CDA1 family)
MAVLITVAALAIIGAAKPAHAAGPTVVSLTFDDGNSDQLAAQPILKSHGMKGTFFVNTGRIGTSGAFTQSNLQSLAADGNEIAGHTVSHPDLTTIDSGEAARQICNDRVTLHNWGFHPTSFAYPFGHTNAQVEQIVRNCGYNSAREVGDIASPVDGGCPGCDVAESIPPDDPYNVRAPDSVESDWTAADVEQLVTQAENSGGGWVVLTFHHICSGCAPSETFSAANLTALLDWLQQRAGRGTVVRTVQQVIGGTEKPYVSGPPAQGGTTLQNTSLETDANSDGIPDCWALGGFGTSTASFSRVNDAHSGNWAERLTISGYTSGDRKLVVSQDLGSCAPEVTPGHRLQLGVYYKATDSSQIVAYYRDGTGGWNYWTSSSSFPATSTYTLATWTTPSVPSGATGFSFGLNLATAGTLTTDDYSMSDIGSAPPPVTQALTDNPSLERATGSSVPDCYQLGSSGTNTATWTRTSEAHTGSFGERVDITAYTTGDRKLVTEQDNATCSPAVTPGDNYQISTWYKSSVPTRFVVFYRNPSGVWSYAATGPTLAAAADWTQAAWTVTPPSTATAMSFGLSIGQVGSLTTDDYAAVDQSASRLPQPALAVPVPRGD